MLLSPPGPPRAVVLVPRPGTDSYGDPVDDWSVPERVPLPGAVVQDRTSTETPEDGRPDRLRTLRVLFVDGVPSALSATARVEIDGEVWHVDGDPLVRRGLLGAHTVATLSREAG